MTNSPLMLSPDDALRLQQRREAFRFTDNGMGTEEAVESSVSDLPATPIASVVTPTEVTLSASVPPIEPPVPSAPIKPKPKDTPTPPIPAPAKALPVESLRRLVSQQLTSRAKTAPPPSLEALQNARRASSTQSSSEQETQNAQFGDHTFSDGGDDWDELDQLIGSVEWDSLDSLHSYHAHEKRVINEDLDAIAAPLGISDANLNVKRSFCGQPEWALLSPDDTVPKGSYYDGWIWSAAGRQSPNSTLVEVYVSAEDEYGMIDTLSTRRDGTEVKGHLIEPKKPVFSYDHHTLQAIDKNPNAPWGDADRVLLIPVTFKGVLTKKKSYNGYTPPPRTEYYPDIVAANPMLHGEDTNAHVIHGRCSLSFIDHSSGQERYAEYWVVLSKEELQRRHAQWNSTLINNSVSDTQSKGGLNQAELTLLEHRFQLRPNERFLGSVVGADAQRLYEQAKAGRGIVMPNDWTEDEVARLQSRHKGIAAQHEAQVEREQMEQYITPMMVRG